MALKRRRDDSSSDDSSDDSSSNDSSGESVKSTDMYREEPHTPQEILSAREAEDIHRANLAHEAGNISESRWITTRNTTLGNRAVWETAWQDRDSVYDETWVESSVLNFHLNWQWYSLGRDVKLTYVDFFAARDLGLSSNRAETIAAYQRSRFINVGERPYQSLVTVVHHSNHYYALLIVRVPRAVHILGKAIHPASDGDNTSDSVSLSYYRWLCELHNWPYVNKFTLHRVDWPQDGHNCGPNVIAVIDDLLMHGLRYASDNKTLSILRPPCGHVTRIHLLECLYHQTLTLKNCSHSAPLYDDLHWPTSLSVWPELQQLKAARDQCASCVHVPTGYATPQQAGFENEQEEEDSIEQEFDRATLQSALVDNLEEAEGVRPEDEQGLQQRDEDETYIEDETSTVPATTNQSTVNSLPQSSTLEVRRFGRSVKPPFIPKDLRGAWMKHDEDFDDYIDLSDPDNFAHLFARDPIVEKPALRYHTGAPPTYSPGDSELFRDYGYRLSNNFSHEAFLTDPYKPLEHTLCVGLPRSAKREPELMDLEHTVDVSRVSIKGMLTRSKPADEHLQKDAADRIERELGRKVFVAGRDPQTGHYLQLDPEKARVKLNRTEVDFNTDIDSFLYVGRNIKCTQPIALCCGPTVGNGPPMSGNAHVTISLVMPKLDPDEEHERELKISVNGVPHMEFARITEGIAPVTIFVAFPRMKHRHPVTNQHQTMMAHSIQRVWLDNLLLPAMEKWVAPSRRVYLAQSVEQAQRRTVTEKARQGNVTHIKPCYVAPNELQNILEEIRDNIRWGNDDLTPDEAAIFGSFYFAIECKGIKLRTKTKVPGDGFHQAYKTPFTSLTECLPMLDWEFMQNRMEGELYLDVAFTVDPKERNDGGVVGQWRLNALEGSFGAGGYLAGNLHHSNGLNNYGGIQARMGEARMRHTQIVFRSAYNLHYEATRLRTNKSVFAMEGEAMINSEKFHTDCERLMKDFKDAKNSKRSFGVRDEYRMTAAAAIKVLDLCHTQMEQFWQAKPIMWLKTEDWFEFCYRRIFHLMNAQMDLVHIAPNNLGTITTVLVYLMKTINSTPKLLSPWLRDALRTLNMAQVQGRFGMLFLHSWDPSVNRETPLEELCWEDEIQLLTKMQVESTLPIELRHRQLLVGHPPSIEYPLGSHPCWADVKSLIRERPYMLIQVFKYNEDWDAHPVATAAFIKMTNHLLSAVLHTERRRGRRSAVHLEEAMEEWSYLSLNDTIYQCGFEANNSSMRTGEELNSDTASSRFDRTFRMMCKDFFPPPNAPRPQAGPWTLMWNLPGYIGWYHQQLADLTAPEIQQITDALQTIFHNLQCLPVCQFYRGVHRSEQGRLFDRNKKDHIRMVTNPRWYSLEHIVLDRADATHVHRAQQPPRKAGATNPRKTIEDRLMRLEGLSESHHKQRAQKRAEQRKRARADKTKKKRKAPKASKKQTGLVQKGMSPPAEKAPAPRSKKASASGQKRGRPAKRQRRKAPQPEPEWEEEEEEEEIDGGEDGVTELAALPQLSSLGLFTNAFSSRVLSENQSAGGSLPQTPTHRRMVSLADQFSQVQIIGSEPQSASSQRQSLVDAFAVSQPVSQRASPLQPSSRLVDVFAGSGSLPTAPQRPSPLVDAFSSLPLVSQRQLQLVDAFSASPTTTPLQSSSGIWSSPLSSLVSSPVVPTLSAEEPSQPSAPVKKTSRKSVVARNKRQPPTAK